MLAYLYATLYTVTALWLLTGVGNWACRILFSLTGMKDAIASTAVGVMSAGRIIGWLERLIIAVGVIAHSWEILGAVIALKTVARFKELDKQLPAEYFLIGSLFSILWAIVMTGAWIGYDHVLGIDLRSSLIQIFHLESVSGLSSSD